VVKHPASGNTDWRHDMSELGQPTAIIRDFAGGIADRLDHAMGLADQACRELLDEPCFANGIRSATVKARSQCEDVQATVLKLRQAIHDDYGTPPEDET